MVDRVSSESPSRVSSDERERGERFLSAYAVIEQEMRRRWGNPAGRESFRHLVDVLKSKDSLIRKFKDDLEEFSELRNAIVHERISPDYLIAVPLPETVAKIETIAGILTNPPLVYPRFGRPVFTLQVHEPASRVLKATRDTDFSQFPVYDGSRYVGLLTNSGISRWVASLLCDESCGPSRICPPPETSAGQDTASKAFQWNPEDFREGLREDPREGFRKDLQVDLRNCLLNARIADILAYEKDRDRARFISRYETIYEAQEMFRDGSFGHRWRTAALLITETGNPRESLLGIVTPSDMVSVE